MKRNTEDWKSDQDMVKENGWEFEDRKDVIEAHHDENK